jgi:hypothetical protein
MKERLGSINEKNEILPPIGNKNNEKITVKM